MIRLTDGMTLYHGSYAEVSTIDLDQCQSGLDFGRGFYLTSSLAQARAFVPSSIRKAVRRNRIPKGFRVEDGVVSVFMYHADPNIFVHHFEKADAEWLHYVACNRDESLFRVLRKKYETVDIVCGKIADDKTAFTLNNYVLGAYGVPGQTDTDRRTIEILEPENLQDQFCFKTEQSIACLSFVRSMRYGEIELGHHQ